MEVWSSQNTFQTCIATLSYVPYFQLKYRLTLTMVKENNQVEEYQ